MRIGFYATLRKPVGGKYLDLDVATPCTLEGVLVAVIEARPTLRELLLDAAGELDRSIHLVVDGRSSKYLPDGMRTVVDGGVSIDFFPAVAGG